MRIGSATLAVDICEKTGSFSITDIARGVTHVRDPWEQNAGTLVLRDQNGRRFRLQCNQADETAVEKKGDRTADISFHWKDAADAALSVGLEVQDSDLLVTVRDLSLNDGRLSFVELVYPERFGALLEAEDAGGIVMPSHCGIWIPANKTNRPGGSFFMMDDRPWYRDCQNMRGAYSSGLWRLACWGMVKEKSACLVVIEDPWDCLPELNIRTNLDRTQDGRSCRCMSWVSPVWIPSLQEFRYARRVRYRFVGEGSYVEIAKAYREYVIAQGRFRSLKEKIADRPDVEQFIGATHIDLYSGYPHYVRFDPTWASFDEIEKMIDDMHDGLKLDRVTFVLWGAFEQLPPTCYPVSRERGGVEGLKKVADKCRKYGYLYSSYHAYSCLLQHADNFDPSHAQVVHPGADIMRDITRWSRNCSTYYERLAREYLPKELADIGQNSDFTDIIGGTVRECYGDHDENHPHDRRQYMLNKRKVYEYVVNELRLPNGTEHGGDWNSDIVDCISEHAYAQGGSYYLSRPVPFVSLVFHDSFVAEDHPGTSYGFPQKSTFPQRVLDDLCFGHAPLHSLQSWEYPGMKEQIRQIHNLVAGNHRRIGTEELVRHDFLDEMTFFVQRSEFSDGSEVWTNSGPNPFDGPDGALPPGGYLVLKDGRILMKGRVVSEIRTE